MLSFNQVYKFYPIKNGKKTILKNVTFNFSTPTNLGILGVNGAGKSTFLRLISGSELPDAGLIKRQGRFSWPLGFSGGFNGNLSGEENLRFICRIYGVDIPRVREYVEDFSELGKSLFEPIRTYSSGMRARLAFGLSLAIDFDVYLIDEVMTVGDPTFRKKSQQAFEERSRYASLIIISHEMKNIRDYAEKIIFLSNGDALIYDDVEQGIKEYQNLSGSKK